MGRAHVGRAELGEHRTVAVADHGVDHRLRMDDHLDLVGAHGEQMHGLDHLERLVEHRGAVDGDLDAHRPVGMRGGHIRRNRGHFRCIQRTERPARSGEDDAFDAVALILLEYLVDRVVLAVDRKQPAAAGFDFPVEEFAGRNQALLVGERDVGTAAGRGERRRQPGHPDDAGHAPVRVALGGLDQRRRSGGGLDAAAGEGGFQGRIAVFVGGDGDFSPEGDRLAGQQVGVSLAAESANPESVTPAQVFDDVEGVAADRPGRSEYADTARGR